MDVERLIPGIIGAIVGVVGWLLVGIFMQRRQFERQAKSAGRAVYFELLLNRMHVVVARDYATFLPLSRSAFERLLPELATWLPAATLQLVVGAYMGQAGYAQASAENDAPPELQRRAIAAIEVAHRAALDGLRPRLFTPKERVAIANLDGAPALDVATTDSSPGHAEAVGR